MELHQLRYVVQVAKHLNFSKAADELYLSQPNLSQQISKLETEIGVTLYERKTRSVKLTPAGEVFVRHAEKILAELDNLQLAMQECSGLGAGEIGIGILSAGGQRLISHFPAFQKQYPGVHLRIVESAGSPELIHLLQSGQIDVAYLIQPATHNHDHKLRFDPLIRGSIVLIVDERHRFADRERISFSELAAERFVFPPRALSMHNSILNVCRASGFEPKITCECGPLNTVLDLVAAGLGVAFASSPILDALQLKQVKTIFLDPVIERTVSLATLEDKHHLPVISVFRNFMLDAISRKNELCKTVGRIG